MPTVRRRRDLQRRTVRCAGPGRGELGAVDLRRSRRVVAHEADALAGRPAARHQPGEAAGLARAAAERPAEAGALRLAPVDVQRVGRRRPRGDIHLGATGAEPLVGRQALVELVDVAHHEVVETGRRNARHAAAVDGRRHPTRRPPAVAVHQHVELAAGRRVGDLQVRLPGLQGVGALRREVVVPRLEHEDPSGHRRVRVVQSLQIVVARVGGDAGEREGVARAGGVVRAAVEGALSVVPAPVDLPVGGRRAVEVQHRAADGVGGLPDGRGRLKRPAVGGLLRGRPMGPARHGKRLAGQHGGPQPEQYECNDRKAPHGPSPTRCGARTG